MKLFVLSDNTYLQVHECSDFNAFCNVLQNVKVFFRLEKDLYKE